MNHKSSKIPSQIFLQDYKLIIFDIDGTLVGSSHILDSFTRDVLLRLHDHKIPFTLATGKNLPATRQIAEELKIEIPLVLSNGSMIETRYGQVLAKSSLPEDVTRRVMEISARKNSNLVLYIDNDIVMQNMNDDIYQIYQQVADEVIEVGYWQKIEGRIADINKCLVVELHDYQNLVELEKIFRQEVGQFADILFTSKVLLEVLPKGITKITGIQKLTDKLGIQMKDVMAFGDYDNDVEMLQAAGLGVVVANGSEAALESADLIIEACDENGPAKFLDALIKKI